MNQFTIDVKAIKALIEENQRKRILEAYEEYKGPLMRYLNSRCKNQAEAEDLMHTTFQTLLEVIDRGQTPIRWNEIGKFLTRIARNALIDQKRKEKRAREAFGIIESMKVQARVNRRAKNVVLDSVEEDLQLSDRAKEVFRLKFYAGMKREEIADILDTSVPTVTRDLRKVLDVLNAQLDQGLIRLRGSEEEFQGNERGKKIQEKAF